MILTSGGRFGGYGFYLLKGKPVWLWNLVDLKRVKWEGADALTPGKHIVEFEFKYDGLGPGTLAYNNFSGVGRGGTGTLKVDGKAVATQTMEKTLPMILQWDESFDIGSDTLTGVNDADYTPPFPLTAKLNKLTIKVDRPHLSPADTEKLQSAMSAAADGPVSGDLRRSNEWKNGSTSERTAESRLMRESSVRSRGSNLCENVCSDAFVQRRSTRRGAQASLRLRRIARRKFS